MPIRGEGHYLGPFHKGVIYSLTAEEIPLDALYACENIEIGFGGEAKKRKGSDLVNSSALNSGATITACGKHEFSATSSAYFAIAGDKFYEDVDGTPVDRTGGLTITAGDDNTFHLVDMDGTLVGHNGVAGDSLIKWAAENGNIAALDVDSRFTWAKWWSWWDGRPWAANNSVSVAQLNYGSNTDIETWAANDTFTHGNDISGIAPLGDEALVIHGKNQMSIITPTQITDTPYSRYGRGTKGTISGRAIACIPGPNGSCIQVYPRREGFFKYDGSGEAQKISYQLDGPRYWDNVNKDRLHQSFAVHYALKNCIWFYIPYGSGQTNMNHIMVYDYARDMWYGPYVNGDVLERFSGSIVNDKPHFGGDDGFMYIHEQNDNDDNGSSDQKIDGWFQCSSKPPLGSDVSVRWLHALINYEVLNAANISASQYTTGIGTNSYTFSQDGGYDKVGVDFQVGVSKIGGELVTAVEEMKLQGYDPHSIIKIQNTEADQPFSIRQVIQVYRPIGRQRKGAS
jgi:hypothetical protein